MNGTTLELPDVAAYLAAVRAGLADLPAEERDDLLADVEASLLDSGEPPALSPREFAEELREAAGLSRGVPAAAQASPLDSLREWLSSGRVASWLRIARELAPIWWVVRAYVVVSFFSLVSTGSIEPLGAGSSQTGPMDTLLLLFLLALPASIWLGFRTRRGSGSFRRAVLIVNALVVVSLFPVVPNSLDGIRYSSSVYHTVPPTPGLAVDGAPVRNIYPYSRNGELLQDVLLYTDEGAPLALVTGTDDIDRRILETTAGPIFNSFPIRYFDPGTGTVGQPELGPPVAVPTVTTPELSVPKG